MGIFQRIFGICQTKPPADPGSWTASGDTVTLDLAKLPELSQPGGAVRLEGGSLAQRIMVFVDDNGKLHAISNKCTHAGRRLDPIEGGVKVQCCSVGKSTFTPEGDLLGGSAKKPVKIFALEQGDGKLTISLS